MALSKEEKAQLEALQAKEQEPPEGRQEHVNVTIDLSDPAAVKRAIKLGYLTAADLENENEGEGASEEEGEEEEEEGKPKGKRDPAPKRRLNLADRTLGGTEE